MAATTAPPRNPPPPTATAQSNGSASRPTPLQFKFERGQTKNGVHANAVGNALEFLRERDGVVNARAFVDYSRPEDAETHPIFEWNEAVAAENYRVIQARETIRELRVVPTSSDMAPASQGPVYVHVRQAQTPINGYAPAWVVVTRPDWTEQAKTECMTQLLGLERRYRFLEQLTPIWQAILRFQTDQTADDQGDISDPDQDQLDDGV